MPQPAPDMEQTSTIREPKEANRGLNPLNLESQAPLEPPGSAWWALVFLNMASLWVSLEFSVP
jgi:hypothetical protein